MNVSLTPELDQYVLAKVHTGRYNSASEVLREALRLMQERDELREIQLEEARSKIREGLNALESGKFDEGTSAELYEQAIARSRKRLEARKDQKHAG
jgi:antitoxin ParD1/3/4